MISNLCMGVDNWANFQSVLCWLSIKKFENLPVFELIGFSLGHRQKMATFIHFIQTLANLEANFK